MTTKELQQLKFPVGEYTSPQKINEKHIAEWIITIKDFHKKVKQLTENLTTEQKNWRYRPDGWKIKQVVHHCADSHMNSIIRFKLAITEENPKIRPYYEDRWAELIDSQDDDLENSLLLLTGLHNKWAQLLESFSATDLKREFIHPEHGRRFVLDEAIGMYAWHCNHHLAHIKQALEAKGKYNG